MSCRFAGIVCVLVGLGAAQGAAGASKTYRKPATVPAAKVVATTLPSTLLPIPSEGEVERAMKLVRGTFAEDYRPGSVGKRREFARELFRQGVATRDDAAARYVLLVDAADIGAGAGDAMIVSRAVDELARSFQIDPHEMKAIKLGEAAKSAYTREAIEALVTCALAAEETALVGEEYEVAGRLVTIAESAAERGRRVDLKLAVAERRKEFEAIRVGREEFVRAQETLAKSPGDGGASLTAGRFLCLVRGDWDKGLPMLAGGSDEGLRGLAVKDLENPGEAGARAMIGDGWWDWAGKLTGVSRKQVRKRALYWYRQAMAAGLSGVNREAVLDRLKEIQVERMRGAGLSPGLVAEMFEGEKGEKRRLSRVDPQIDFDFQDKPAGEGVPKDHFSITWSGQISAPQTGSYTFIVIANQGASVEIDGTNVFENGDLTRKKNGERVSVRLEEGLHSFRMRFWDGTGLAKVRLLWVPPGGTEEVVPGEVFCHEAGELAEAGMGPVR